MTYDEEIKAVREAENSFPEMFRISTFPGDTFRINKRAGFYDSREGVQVVMEVKVKAGSSSEKMYPGREWLDFMRTSPDEIRRYLRPME